MPTGQWGKHFKSCRQSFLRSWPYIKLSSLCWLFIVVLGLQSPETPKVLCLPPQIDGTHAASLCHVSDYCGCQSFCFLVAAVEIILPVFVTLYAGLNLRTQSYISSSLGGELMKLGLVGRGVRRCDKLFFGFLTYHSIIGEWGSEQKEEKAHLEMTFKNLS